jgi:hypothetical protein
MGKKRKCEGHSTALFSLSRRNEASLEAEETRNGASTNDNPVNVLGRRCKSYLGTSPIIVSAPCMERSRRLERN